MASNKKTPSGFWNEHNIKGLSLAGLNNIMDIVAENPQMKNLLRLLGTVANTDASILLTGASGTGKEVLARYVHAISDRRDKRFITINCGGIPENLLESELFGYSKGSFTGASGEGKEGLIEAADGGTLFLDEINSMPLAIQVKFLRVLEIRKVLRLGDVVAKPVDFRLISASGTFLDEMVENKQFRKDLYYRINVVPVRVPSLSERKEDIIPLAEFFLKGFCKKYNINKEFGPKAKEEMQSYEWPGNVREIRNAVERAIVISPHDEKIIDHIRLGLKDVFEDISVTGTGSDINPASIISAADSISEEAPSISPDDIRIDETNGIAEILDSLIQSDDFSFSSYINWCENNLVERLLADGMEPQDMINCLKISRSSVFRLIKQYREQK